MSQSYAQPHSHGGRSHTHALPTQGIGHRHGNSAIGESASNRVTTSAPANYIADKKGCFHFNENPMPNESLTWTGKCIKGYAEGDGDQKWFLNGKPNGGGNTSLKRGKMFFGEPEIVNSSNLRLSNSNLANLCDELAGNPNDPHKVGEGILFDKINGSKAVMACKSALVKEPSNARYLLNLGRAYNKLKDYDKSYRYTKDAADLFYPYAYHALGLHYLYGEGVRKSETSERRYILKATEYKVAIAFARMASILIEDCNGEFSFCGREEFKKVKNYLDKARSLGYVSNQIIGDYYYYLSEMPLRGLFPIKLSSMAGSKVRTYRKYLLKASSHYKYYLLNENESDKKIQKRYSKIIQTLGYISEGDIVHEEQFELQEHKSKELRDSKDMMLE